MVIQLLTPVLLGPTVMLAKRVFSEPDDHPEEALRGIFEPHLYPRNLIENGIFNRICWVVLATDGSVAGMVGLYRQLADYRDSLHVGWFCVAPDVRKKGVGTALLEHVIGEARKSGVAYLRLDTADDLVEARRLYETRGFRLTETLQKAGYVQMWYELALS